MFLFLLSILLSEPASATLDGYYFQSGCAIHNMKGGKVKEIPGDYCIFLDDGGFITASASSLKYFGRDYSMKWKMDVPVHHQMNLSHDKKRILVLSSVVSEKGRKKSRDDRFLIVSLEGEILSEKTIAELLPEEKLLNLPITNLYNVIQGVASERSHFNSFYEIPPHKNSSNLEWMRPGNLILNSIKLGIVILSPDLSKVLHSFTYPHSSGHQVHDVQILPSGNLLLFNNVSVAGTDEVKVSTVDEIDPVTMEPRFIFGGSQENHFYSGSRSGAHAIGDDYLVFSLEWQGVYVYSRKEKRIVISTYEVNVGRGYVSNQNVRFYPLKNFLGNIQSNPFKD